MEIRENTVFGRRLKELRVERGYSQKELGIAIGMKSSSASARINQYEQGVHLPKYDVAMKLANELDVYVSCLYESDEFIFLLSKLIHTFPLKTKSLMVDYLNDILK